MGNKIEIGKVKSGTVVGGNVSGGLNNSSDDDVTKSKEQLSSVKPALELLEKSSGKMGLTLAIIFALLLIVLFVITR